MSIKYKKNPATYSQPDLFTALGDTPNFIPLDDLSEEEIKGLPFAAFSMEEFLSLPESWQLHIWNGDPETKAVKRLDFDDTQWGELPESLQEEIYEQDKDSKARVRSLANALIEAVPEPDADTVLRDSENEIDERFSDDAWLWDMYGETLMEKLQEAYPNIEFDEDEVMEAAGEYGFSQANFEFTAIEGTDGEISARVDGYYLERDRLYDYFPQAHTVRGRGGVTFSATDKPLDPESMPEDEVEKAVEIAGDEDPKFGDCSVDARDVWKLIHAIWGPIQRDPSYEEWSISLEPNWEEIVNDTADHLDLEPDRVHYEEHLPQERILFSGRQIGSPEDIVETTRVTFPLGDTYYALDLIPSELKKETKRGRNCVGREENGYPDALRAGRIRLLSIRPETDENVWKRTYLMELVLDEPDTTSTLKEIIERGGIDYVEQIKGYNNRVPGFDRGLYDSGTARFVSPEEARALLDIVENDLRVQRPFSGTDTQNYIVPALARYAGLEAPLQQNPGGQACPITTPGGEHPYSFNVHTKN